MKSLKLDDDDLHRRFKMACVATGTPMMTAVRLMVTAWVADVERRIPDIRAESPASTGRGTRRSPGRPSRHQTLAANGQQEIPSDAP